jgi:hypothetical protein
MELNPEIKPNKAGFRVRSTEFTPPPGARGFTKVGGIYYWTDTDVWQQMDEQKVQAQPPADHKVAKNTEASQS